MDGHEIKRIARKLVHIPRGWKLECWRVRGLPGTYCMTITEPSKYGSSVVFDLLDEDDFKLRVGEMVTGLLLDIYEDKSRHIREVRGLFEAARARRAAGIPKYPNHQVTHVDNPTW